MQSPSSRSAAVLHFAWVWALTAAALLLDASSASGQSLKPQNPDLPIPFRTRAGDPWIVDPKIEVSALELIDEGRGLLLAADDKTPEPRIVELKTGRIVGVLKSPILPPPSEFGPKWEGMARDAQGWIYLIGSHSGVSEAERRERERLLRFRLIQGSDGSFTIDQASARRWSIERSLVESLRREGLKNEIIARRKIEGLAVREANKQLIVGLREPDDRVRVYAIDIAAPPEDGAVLKLSKLFEFDPGSNEGVKFTLNSLHHSPKLGGFLIVTATEDVSNVYHGNALWRLADSQIPANGGPVRPELLWTFETAMKAEGACELPNADNNGVRIVIAFDNDASKTKIPSRLMTVTIGP